MGPIAGLPVIEEQLRRTQTAAALLRGHVRHRNPRCGALVEQRGHGRPTACLLGCSRECFSENRCRGRNSCARAHHTTLPATSSPARRRSNCGEGGIRTRGGLLIHARLASGYLRPLGHLSGVGEPEASGEWNECKILAPSRAATGPRSEAWAIGLGRPSNSRDREPGRSYPDSSHRGGRRRPSGAVRGPPERGVARAVGTAP
jgi:hypothetical protein